jgi:hypothetical protein
MYCKDCKGREAICRRILVDKIKATMPYINKTSSFIWAGFFITLKISIYLNIAGITH